MESVVIFEWMPLILIPVEQNWNTDSFVDCKNAYFLHRTCDKLAYDTGTYWKISVKIVSEVLLVPLVASANMACCINVFRLFRLPTFITVRTIATKEVIWGTMYNMVKSLVKGG